MAKSRQDKEQLLAQYKEIIASQDFVIVETFNMPAAPLTQLRRDLSEVNAGFYIIKNRVFQIALQEYNQMKEITLEGNHAVITGGDDITAALKKVEDGKKLMKETLMLKVDTPEELAKYTPYNFVMGYVQGQVLDASGVDRLRNLPSREALLGQFVGLLNAPLTGFMQVLRGNVRQLAYALNDLAQQKG